MFFKEHLNGEFPAIQKYKDKINYYQDKCPFQFKGNYLLARDMGMDVEFKQDGSPYGTPVFGQEGKAQAFYNDLWAKRNLPYTMDEYRKNCPTHNLIEINLNFLEISFSNLA